MLELTPVQIEDKEWVAPLMHQSNFMGSEYTFANLFNWSTIHNLKVARLDNWVIIKSGNGDAGSFAFPAGYGDIKKAVAVMEEYCKTNGQPFVIYSINETAKQLLEDAFPNRFSYTEVRDNFDYIYLRENLATLAGGKYHGKRNHIARFKDNCPDWSYETITEQNLHEIVAMNNEWCKSNNCSHDHSLKKEYCAIRSAFDHYFQLDLKGGLLRTEGKVIAYTFGSQVTDNTFVVHAEKAFSEIQGAYPMINQQFVINELSQYEFINREDDLGQEGLRRAKESYRPISMYKRYVAKELV